MRPNLPFKSIAALCMAIGIVLGAFGAHAFKPSLSTSAFSAYETGVLYWLLHALAMLVITPKPARSYLMLLGMLCFSGSLFFLSTRELHGFTVQWLGPITPVGGLLLVLSWVLIAHDLFRNEDRN